MSNNGVVAEIRRAWEESQASDPDARHEEGGYVVLGTGSVLAVERWPRGQQFRIQPPPLENGNRYNGKTVVATFHTHPNPPLDEEGRQWEQGPSCSDQRWHAAHAIRGYVVSGALVYEIDSAGNVSAVGGRDEVLSA